MAKDKAKSQKACGLNPMCYINKAVKSVKKSMGSASKARHDNIQKQVENAEQGKAGS